MKMNILFVNANLYGHINPTLGLVKKLTERGNTVSYYCSEDFSEQVSKAGGKVIGFSNRLDLFLKEFKPSDRHPFFMLMEYLLLYDEVMLPEILSLLKEKSYDLIICDSIFGGACFLKEITEIPVMCSHSSFALSHAPVPQRMLVAGTHPQLDYCYQVLDRLCKRYDIKKPTLEQVFTSKGELNIVYTTESFNGDIGVKEPEYLFAGPSLDRSQESENLDFLPMEDRLIIYISLGSLNTNFIDFYRTCISAFRDTNYFVFMSIGKKCEVSKLGELPSNFYVRSFLPQLEILKHANIFITHAGFNSVNEALYFGVPMLALPLVNDQHMTAKRLAEMQLGITGNMKEMLPETLREMVEKLSANATIKKNCMLMSHEMCNSINLDLTAEKIETYAKSRKERNDHGDTE